jgi:hypothetical protein
MTVHIWLPVIPRTAGLAMTVHISIKLHTNYTYVILGETLRIASSRSAGLAMTVHIWLLVIPRSAGLAMTLYISIPLQHVKHKPRNIYIRCNLVAVNKLSLRGFRLVGRRSNPSLPVIICQKETFPKPEILPPSRHLKRG